MIDRPSAVGGGNEQRSPEEPEALLFAPGIQICTFFDILKGVEENKEGVHYHVPRTHDLLLATF